MYGKKSPSSKRIKSNPSDEKWIECNLSFRVSVKSVAPESRKKIKIIKKKKKTNPSISVSGVGSGNPFQYSCLENSMDRGAWLTKVHGFSRGQT